MYRVLLVENWSNLKSPLCYPRAKHAVLAWSLERGIRSQHFQEGLRRQLEIPSTQDSLYAKTACLASRGKTHENQATYWPPNRLHCFRGKYEESISSTDLESRPIHLSARTKSSEARSSRSLNCRQLRESQCRGTYPVG